MIKLLQAHIHSCLIPLFRLVYDGCYVLCFVSMRGPHHHCIPLCGSLTIQVIQDNMLWPWQGRCRIALCWDIQQRQLQVGRHPRGLLSIVVWGGRWVVVAAVHKQFIMLNVKKTALACRYGKENKLSHNSQVQGCYEGIVAVTCKGGRSRSDLQQLRN